VIPISRPDIGPDEVAAVAEVLASGVIAQGPRVAEFEDRWADYVGVRHAVAVANGTVALGAVLAGLGIGPGDEVVTVAHTFSATVAAIVACGATPVFVDVEPDTYLIDASRIESAIGPRTSAIMPVHLFGLVADMDMIEAIAARHGLAIVEDAAQAHGATFRGRRAGSFGHAVFSLYATKNLTTGEGGIVTTYDDRLADWLRAYRNQGMREPYRHEILGTNLRLTDIAAAIGLAGLDRLDRNNERRRMLAARYDMALAGLPLRTPMTPTGREHVFHQYTVVIGDDRDRVLAALQQAGVGARVYYPTPVHRQPYVLERGIHADLPVTDRLAAETLSLPIFPGLTEREQDQVVAALRSAVASPEVASAAVVARGTASGPSPR
jgi:dTDP-4-amino-4,6-dideoxygalactose transaminase